MNDWRNDDTIKVSVLAEKIEGKLGRLNAQLLNVCEGRQFVAYSWNKKIHTDEETGTKITYDLVLEFCSRGVRDVTMFNRGDFSVIDELVNS